MDGRMAPGGMMPPTVSGGMMPPPGMMPAGRGFPPHPHPNPPGMMPPGMPGAVGVGVPQPPPGFSVNAPKPISGGGPSGPRAAAALAARQQLHQGTGLPMDIFALFKPRGPVRPFFAVRAPRVKGKAAALSTEGGDDDGGDAPKAQEKDVTLALAEDESDSEEEGGDEHSAGGEQKEARGPDVIVVPKKKKIVPAYSGVAQYVSLFEDAAGGDEHLAAAFEISKTGWRQTAKAEKLAAHRRELEALKSQCTLVSNRASASGRRFVRCAPFASRLTSP